MSEHLEITIVSTPKIGVKFRRKCMIFTEEDMKVAEDGSVMVLMTQDRDDDSASELMVFRLTGF